MSDDEREIDIDSDSQDYDDDFDEDNQSSSGRSSANNTQFMTMAQKRAHHNALERKRRDHIKDSFFCLRDSVPNLKEEKARGRDLSNRASRAQILKSATEYIQFMKKKNSSVQTDITDLKKQNSLLEQQIRALDRARSTGDFTNSHGGAAASNVLDDEEDDYLDVGSTHDHLMNSYRYADDPVPSKKFKS